jgi:hypothetical protein
MKRIRISLLLAGLLTAGCTSPLKRPDPPQTQTTSAARPVVADDGAVAPKLVPHDELNAANAKSQAQILDDLLKKESQSGDAVGHE